MLANMTSISHVSELHNMDKESLVELMLEKERRIQDLERLLDDQKRLRLQDSSQVEEKAAKIKEWVTNKLKELENQNKLLRDQNRKQKEAVESLSIKLATLSPISSPRKRNNNNNNSLDRVQYIDQHSVPSSPIHTIDVNKSLKTRRPQLKKLNLHHQKSNSISSEEMDQNQQQQHLRITLNSSSGLSHPHVHSSQITCETPNVNRNGGVSMVSIGDNNSNSRSPSRRNQRQQQDSPLYDTVNIELVNSSDQQQSQHNSQTNTSSIRIVNNRTPNTSQQQNNAQGNGYKDDENHYDRFHYEEEPEPPPPPMHQFDRWECELYSLAEATFSSLMQTNSHNDTVDNRETITTTDLHDTTNATVRKSSSSLRNDIISVIKPSFTTIDGDQVVEDTPGAEREHLEDHVLSPRKSSDHEQQRRVGSRDHLSRTSSSSHNRSVDLSGGADPQNASIYSPKSHSELIKQKSTDGQLFSSPMRSRSGKDSILRTQSVRRQPAPEKLYDFIATDLVKRGYLIKHGALRSHQRWFVLRNFHLYSYKRESEETDHASPTLSLKLEPSFQVQVTSQSSNDGQYPFKLTPSSGGGGKSVLLIADSAQLRDEWCQILTVAINMSDIEPEQLTKSNSAHEGMLAVTRHGHTKRCHAVLVKHVVFFLKSPIDPTPMGYISVKGAKIREVMDNYDYDLEEQESLKHNRQSESVGGGDCSLAIYPRYSLNLDPVYLTLGSQQDTDEWFYHMSGASGMDQSSGTEFERILTQSMLDNSIVGHDRHRKNSTTSLADSLARSGCLWREHSIMIYTDRPLTQPLTSLPNETLRVEATELFKSILLFTQVPMEPIAIDYHICLLQNCLTRFLKYPELRNEFFAQLIKQSTYVMHCCGSRSKLSSISSSGGGSSGTQRSSDSSLSPTVSECQFVTDLRSLESMASSNRAFSNKFTSISRQQSHRGRSDAAALSPRHSHEESNPAPPTRGELLQVMQIIAIAVSVNLPRGRLRWWLAHHLHKFANPTTEVGKYALYSLKAIDRTAANGCRDNIPSRTELLSILLRNPYDHSTAHSLPVSFADGSYHVIGADGSTTVEEFMLELGKSINVRPSPQSDFYLFADDPAKDSNTKDLHILEPQRKVLDVVGWWEQSFKQGNIGRQQNTRVIKLICKKRLLLKVEEGETERERSLIMSQANQEIVSHKIPLSDALIVELGALMTQSTFNDYERSSIDMSALRRISDHILDNFIPATCKLNSEAQRDCTSSREQRLVGQVLEHWQKLSGRTAQDCVRVYLNCIRRLKLGEQ